MFAKMKYMDAEGDRIQATRSDGSVVALERSAGPIGDLYDMALKGKLGEIGEYTPLPPPSDDEVAANLRKKRTSYLYQTDWTQLPDAPVDATKWAEYRQALRDMPTQKGWPHNITWPDPPKVK